MAAVVAASLGSGVVYQSPLAYLLGLEGVALLRAYTGDYDEAFCRARVAEIRRLLADPALGDGVRSDRVDTVGGLSTDGDSVCCGAL